jgi:type VI secretion system secreted protein Hcp
LGIGLVDRLAECDFVSDRRTEGVAMNVEMFLKLSNISGESSAAGHVGEIDISSWSLADAAGISGGGVSKSALHEMRLVKLLDRASPALNSFCAVGKLIDRGVLTVREIGGSDVLVLTMRGITIGTVNVSSGGSASGPVIENFSLQFQEMEAKYADHQPARLPQLAAGWTITTPNRH